ncbi:MAG: polyphosphate polymerase domain-containing protein [Paracoccaceae bacterium]
MKRYEIKYAIDGLGIEELHSMLKMHPMHFRPVYSKRQINNIYFDTWDLSAFIDNIEGERNRKKVRLRWYGQLNDISIKPILEVKQKSGMLGWKERYEVEPIDVDFKKKIETSQLLKFEGGLRDNILQVSGVDLAFLKPTLLNNYEREYYLTADDNFRLTIDTNLQFFDINPLRIFSGMPFQQDRIVVELKFLEEYYEMAEFVTSRLPTRLTKSSKYVVGIDRLRNWI